MGKWRSEFGEADVSFPSILEENKLEFMPLKGEEG